MPQPTSVRQYDFLQLIAHGGHPSKPTSLTAAEAEKGLQETPPAIRRRFAKAAARIRKRRNRHHGHDE